MAKLNRILEIADNADTVKRFRVTDGDGVARVWLVTESAACKFRVNKADANAAIDLSNGTHGSIALETDGIIRLTIKRTHAATLSDTAGFFDVVVTNSADGSSKKLVEGKYAVVRGVTK